MVDSNFGATRIFTAAYLSTELNAAFGGGGGINADPNDDAEHHDSGTAVKLLQL